jgi:Peptidase family M28
MVIDNSDPRGQTIMRKARLWSVAILLTVPVQLSSQQSHPLPLKHEPEPTTAAITPRDLMTRLYIFADDSMQGRETGTAGHVRSTDYIARELRRLGLEPAGDSGSFFQTVPMIRRAFDVASTVTVNGLTLRGGEDFIANVRGLVPSIEDAQVVYGGEMFDTTNLLTPDQVRGKILLLTRPDGGFGRFFGRRRGGAAMQAYQQVIASAAAIATVVDALDPGEVETVTTPRDGAVSMRPDPNGDSGTLTLTVTRPTAETLLGGPLSQAAKGQQGRAARLDVRFRDEPAPARNVVAIVPGRDPALRGEYVAIGAHNDHVGISGRAVDHDSLHLYNAARFAVVGMVPRGVQPTTEQQAAVRSIDIHLDQMRAAHPPRLDSIRNGADDDGSGSVTLLELAEAFARAPVKPKRSILLVWHTGEEKGLLGSRWFADHPTVPRAAIVAQLNMDMVGRGAAQDLPVGGPDYLALVGSRRLSTELGDLVETVNAGEPRPLQFDYQFDADGHPENIYCRSDHYSYARWGIPVAFFTTGLHGDYHQVTDEPQYIDYPHMARIGQLVHDIALQVANLDHRPVVDHAVPDPNAPCRQ